MNCIDYLHDLAQSFGRTIACQPEARMVPTKDYGWSNQRWTSPNWRMAHVELFHRDRLMVVHCCVFPHYHDPSPIFGFDAIAGQHKVTGVFWDLSPTLQSTQPFCHIQGLQNRPRPDWGDIFSDHWVACRPTAAQLVEIGHAAESCLRSYMPRLGQHQAHANSLIVAAHNRYCLQQRKNEHTVRAISSLIGAQLAEEFITTVLFPVSGGEH